MAGALLITLLVTNEGLESRMQTAWDQFVRIAVDLLVIVAIFLIARVLSRFIQRRIWKRIPLDEVTPAIESLVNNTVAIVLYAIAFTATLAFLGASWSTLLTAFSVSTIAVIFGLSDLLKSVLGGAFLIFERPYQVGDRIRIRDNEGEVAEIGVRTTTILTDDGATVVVPNSLHLSEPFRNLDRATRIDSVIHIAGIEQDPHDVRALLQELLRQEPAVDAKIAISSNAELGWSTRFMIWLRSLGWNGREGAVLADPQRVHARLILRVEQANVRATEIDVSQRLRAAFPDAIVTLRRTAFIDEDDKDVD